MAAPIAGGGPTGQRILQIHPSLRCNLQCPHCYSTSGPWARQELDPGLLADVVSDGARMGYQVLSISGGEPFLYSGLSDVLRRARASGMRTTVTTNGYFLDPRYLDPLIGYVDVLAISLDGPPEIHNRMRGSPQAFDRLCAGMTHLRASGINFGFIHTLTNESWIHLLWLAEFAAKNGARLLQLHPLELAGRAETTLKQFAAEGDVLSKIYLLYAALACKYDGVMNIQMDLLHRDQVLAAPELIYAGAEKYDGDIPALQLGVVVLEPDGALVPLTYGFSRRYQICNVKERMPETAWPNFLAANYGSFRQLCREVFDELVRPDAEPLFNWHERIDARSHDLRRR
jgi:MoaA/NifB/PqqE/SkfB family radical SAM enzyme